MDSDLLQKAVAGLLKEGATEVHVFGSFAEGTERLDSDLDLAVKGIPAERWFASLGRALDGVPTVVDVISLDRPGRLAEFLLTHGRLRRVA